MSGYTEEEVEEVAKAMSENLDSLWPAHREFYLRIARLAMKARDKQLGLVTVQTITADDVKKEG